MPDTDVDQHSNVLLGILAAIDAASFEAMQPVAPRHSAGAEAYHAFLSTGEIAFFIPDDDQRRSTEGELERLIHAKQVEASQDTGALMVALSPQAIRSTCGMIGRTMRRCGMALGAIAAALHRCGLQVPSAVPVPDFVPELADLGEGYAPEVEIPSVIQAVRMEQIRNDLAPAIAIRWVSCLRTIDGNRLYQIRPAGWAAMYDPSKGLEYGRPIQAAIDFYNAAVAAEMTRLQASPLSDSSIAPIPLSEAAWGPFLTASR